MSIADAYIAVRRDNFYGKKVSLHGTVGSAGMVKCFLRNGKVQQAWLRAAWSESVIEKTKPYNLYHN
jgi:hypothetical protein